MSDRDDRLYMARALQLAARGMDTTRPNPRVGCVIVRDGEIVGEGWHQQAGGPHAEIHALYAAGDKSRGATAYVTLEPCCHHGRTPPCSQALIDAGIARVVVAMQDPNPQVAGQGLTQLAAAGIDTQSGLLEAEAEALNPGFISRMRRGRPWVRSKLAMSLDGRTAMASGESKWITGESARADVQRWRARSCAILTGAGTVLADDPSLTVREAGFPDNLQPLRVILDPYLSTPPSARMLGLPGHTLILTSSDEEAETAALMKGLVNAGAEVIRLECRGDALDLPAVLDFLGGRQINEVLLETGATLSGAMLEQGLIDEMLIYLAPHLMGDSARGLFHLPGLGEMSQRIQLDIIELRAVGQDWRITAKPK